MLALGNGAPDVFSAIAAGGDSPENGDVLLSVSGLMGSTLFITTVVMMLSINASEDKRIKVTKRFFLRDLIFLFIMCFYLMFAMFYGQINLFVGSGFIIIYVIFVSIVVVQSK